MGEKEKIMYSRSITLVIGRFTYIKIFDCTLRMILYAKDGKDFLKWNLKILLKR